MPGSTHGYDVADPTRLNPEIGDERDVLGAGSRRCARTAWATSSTSCRTTWASRDRRTPGGRTCSRTARARATRRSSTSTGTPLKPELEHKVLLPILGDPYGAVLERQEIRLEYADGAFRVALLRHTCCRSRRAPTTGSSAPAATRCSSDIGAEQRRRRSSSSASSPPSATCRAATSSDPELLRRARAREGSHQAAAGRADAQRRRRCCAHIERAVAAFNGAAGRPAQLRSARRAARRRRPTAWRYWRVAAEEINYRRFFDINELAAIRMEDPDGLRARARVRVRAAAARLRRRPAHRSRRRPVRSRRLPAAAAGARARASRPDVYSDERPLYVVVEKILGADEELPELAGRRHHRLRLPGDGERPVRRRSATSGRSNERLRALHRGCARRSASSPTAASSWSCASAWPSELNVLGAPAQPLLRAQPPLPRLHAEQPDARAARDHRLLPGLPHLRQRARATVSARDRALHRARGARGEAAQSRTGRRRSSTSSATCCSSRPTTSPSSERDEHMRFVGKFQQVTSPVTAKGIEDTAFYIYNRLVSLNEVGGEPDRFGVAPDALHALAGRARRALAARRCRPRRRTTPSAARTCARASTCSRRCPARGSRRRRRWARAQPARPLDRRRPVATRAATRSTCSTRRCSAPGRSSR